VNSCAFAWVRRRARVYAAVVAHSASVHSSFVGAPSRLSRRLIEAMAVQLVLGGLAAPITAKDRLRSVMVGLTFLAPRRPLGAAVDASRRRWHHTPQPGPAGLGADRWRR